MRGVALQRAAPRTQISFNEPVLAAFRANSQGEGKLLSNVTVAAPLGSRGVLFETLERSASALRGGGLRISAAAGGKDFAARGNDSLSASQLRSAGNFHAAEATVPPDGHRISLVDESLAIGLFEAVPLTVRRDVSAAVSIAEMEVIPTPVEWQVVLVENKHAMPGEIRTLDAGAACLPIFYERETAFDVAIVGKGRPLPAPSSAILIDIPDDADEELVVIVSAEDNCELPADEDATVADKASGTEMSMAIDALRKINEEKSVGLAVDAVAESLGPQMTMDVAFALRMVRDKQEMANMRDVLEGMDAAQQARMLKGFVGYRSGRGFRDL